MCRWMRGIRKIGCAYMVEDSAPAVLLTAGGSEATVQPDCRDTGVIDVVERGRGLGGEREGDRGAVVSGADGRSIWRM